MIKDLRQIYGYCSSLEKVRLVDAKKRITSPYFNIHVPSMMNGIAPSLNDIVVEIDTKSIMNDDISSFETSITLAGCIRAKSIHPYTFKHEGWIPEFKTAESIYDKMTMETGTGAEMTSTTSQGMSDMSPGVVAHLITKPFKMFLNSFKKFTFYKNTSTTMVHTNNTEVDFQELNRKYIETDAVLYGCFVSGGDSDEFVIISIDDVVSYYDEDEDNFENNFMVPEDK